MLLIYGSFGKGGDISNVSRQQKTEKITRPEQKFFFFTVTITSLGTVLVNSGEKRILD
jgi:hypothetical protein